MGPQAGGKNFLSEASKRWNDLPKEEKDKYKAAARSLRAKAEPVIAKCLPKRHLPPEASPHKLSDGTWPLAQDEAAKVVVDIRKLSQEWGDAGWGYFSFQGPWR